MSALIGKPVLHIPGATWIVLVLNQAAWCAAVIGGAAGHWWPGIAAVAVVVAVYLVNSSYLGRDSVRLLTSLAIGVIVDAGLGLSGACTFTGGFHDGQLPPPWMWVLWPNFAVLLTGSLSWVACCTWRSAALGLVGGMVAYAAGERLGALQFPLGPSIGCLAVGGAWMITLPLLAWQARPAGGGCHV